MIEIDSLKQFIEQRKQAMMVENPCGPSYNLVRKLTHEQMDRLLSISSSREIKKDFEW